MKIYYIPNSNNKKIIKKYKQGMNLIINGILSIFAVIVINNVGIITIIPIKWIEKLLILFLVIGYFLGIIQIIFGFINIYKIKKNHY
jgi:hypothetical protein